MKIPSYDDLTPGISDIHPRDTFDQVTRLVPCDEPVVAPAEHVRTSARPHAARPHVAPRTSPFDDAQGDPERVEGSHLVRELFACVRAQAGATAAALLSLARGFSPRIERYGDGCVVLDASGLGRLLGDAHGIADQLQRTAFDRGVKVRIAVAPTQAAARLLTLAACKSQRCLSRSTQHAPRLSGKTSVISGDFVRDSADVSVVTGDVALALAPLALDTLQQLVAEPSRTPDGVHPLDPSTGAGSSMFDTLRRWGIRSVGECAALPSDELAARFGREGVAIQRLARGIDPRPLAPDPGIPRFIQSIELEWPIEELEPLSFVFARLLDPLSLALERADKGGAAIRLDLRLVDKSVHTRMLQLPAPMRDARVLRTLLSLDLESHPPSAGIDVVTLEIDPAPARILQFSLLERAIPSPETLSTLTARLNALVGEDRCGSAVLTASYRPDAFTMQRFAPSHSHSLPAPLDPTLVLRRFRPALAVRVGVEQGHPMHVAIDRRGMPGGRVEQYAGPWRTSGAWWDVERLQWDRDEWDVALSDGSVCRLYLDRDTGRWFMEGVMD